MSVRAIDIFDLLGYNFVKRCGTQGAELIFYRSDPVKPPYVLDLSFGQASISRGSG